MEIRRILVCKHVHSRLHAGYYIVHANACHKIFIYALDVPGMGAIQRMNLASATNKDQIIHPLHPVPSLVSIV